MATNALKQLEELVSQGTALAPQGGFEFSGYNARLQNKYLEWRKACLALLDEVGPIGFPYKNKLLGDANGGFFFQSSAQLILNCMKELYEKGKASPELFAEKVAEAGEADQSAAGSTGATRVLKPPPKQKGEVPPKAPVPAATAGDGNKVYVIGDEDDPLRQQVSQFLAEIGVEEVPLNRVHGKMLALDKIEHDPTVRCAFFVFNSEDLAYAMFEVGHFVGKLGNRRVFVVHMSDVEFPKNVPGVIVKPVVVKLEEASLTLMRELKSCGYKLSL